MSSRRLGPLGEIPFRFDGKSYFGREGDTLASALLANGVSVVGRSFKYHRPRGVFGSWAEEPNALFDVTAEGRTTPNARGTTEFLRPGMDFRAVNAWPSAEHDRKGALDRLHRFLPAGFYYKTFLWPDWARFEGRIRAMAGLGRLDPDHAPPADVAHRDAACDLLVVGAGPAGLAAAMAGLRAGKRVTLVDDRPMPGGSLLWRPAIVDGMPGPQWAGGAVAWLRENGARVLLGTTAFGIYDHNLAALWERRGKEPDRLWRLRAGKIVVAAGAIDRPLVFPDNDRPGVMLAEAALAFLRQHEVLVGDRIVVATNNDRAFATAAALAKAGAAVTVADLRQKGPPAPQGVSLRRGVTLEGVVGGRRVEGVTLGGETIEADALLVSGGLTPSVHLFCQKGGKLAWDESLLAFLPREPIPGMVVAGAANGRFALSDALAEGHRAGFGTGDGPRAHSDDETYGIQPAWPLENAKGRQWIDFQNDVTLKDVALAARENFRSVEHLKRYTTLGMATDQGKTSNLNGLAAMAALTGRSIPETGTTTYRPPVVPVPFTAIAGRRRGEFFNPARRLVLENEHRALGARFREYGGWLRPAWYDGDDGEQAIQREARAARDGVAIFDGSPLGKIEVMGPQAGALLDFNSYNTISTLKPGRIRYGFMLTESGVVYDDGVTAKLGDDHYIVSCSSGHVPGVVLRLEEWRQDPFDPANVFVHNMTAQWATLTLTGPQSRRVAEKLGLENLDLGDAALPHMALKRGTWRGSPARVARVSFTGDRSYEISVPSARAAELFAAMQEAGKAFGALAMGSEALLLLRAEKGFLIAGKDTDGTTMPHDLGQAGPRDKRNGEYAGRRSLFMEEARRPDRRQFVGLASLDERPLPTGAHGVERAGGKPRSVGYVTSSYWSPTLSRPVALGLIERGFSRLGEEIEIFHLGQSLRARIAPVCAFDPEGKRLDA
ncbi:MAG TPA: 2Fe-2S iron-sulfur cluster-binding protein [Mesorhizobium sp.]|nr:2Fe-2S iron-sulfur cluster-binding protein [Mesorhizobium sp.]